MANPKVDTFEHDIADEIRHKEASITDIASAVGDIGNGETVAPKSNTPLIAIVVVLIICIALGAGYVGYTYYTSTLTPTNKQTAVAKEQKNTASASQLQSLSPALNQAIGTFITNIKKTKDGYSMEITSYSPVFAYMIKNESSFVDEIGTALGNTRVIQKVMQPVSTTTVITTVSATGTQSTSTQNLASTTEIATQITQELSEEYIFSDLTMSNQNMRIAKSLKGTIVYAFIGSKQLVFSTSPEGILALRSSLLQK